jgi:hypothetical protein
VNTILFLGTVLMTGDPRRVYLAFSQFMKCSSTEHDGRVLRSQISSLRWSVIANVFTVVLGSSKPMLEITPLLTPSTSASELYRPSDRRLSAKLVPSFTDRGCHVVSVTDPYVRIFDFTLFFSSSSSIVLPKLSGHRCRPTTSQRI